MINRPMQKLYISAGLPGHSVQVRPHIPDGRNPLVAEFYGPDAQEHAEIFIAALTSLATREPPPLPSRPAPATTSKPILTLVPRPEPLEPGTEPEPPPDAPKLASPPPRPDRDEAIEKIRAGLKARSDRAWSVTGGRGTAWGWITIIAPPKRRNGGSMTNEDCAELGRLLGLPKPVHHQGEQIAPGGNFRTEYIARAEGRTPEVLGEHLLD